jgi:hypothetical protein
MGSCATKNANASSNGMLAGVPLFLLTDHGPRTTDHGPRNVADLAKPKLPLRAVLLSDPNFNGQLITFVPSPGLKALKERFGLTWVMIAEDLEVNGSFLARHITATGCCLHLPDSRNGNYFIIAVRGLSIESEEYIKIIFPSTRLFSAFHVHLLLCL